MGCAFREWVSPGGRGGSVRGGTSLDVRFKVWGVFREVTVGPVVLAFKLTVTVTVTVTEPRLNSGHASEELDAPLYPI